MPTSENTNVRTAAAGLPEEAAGKAAGKAAAGLQEEAAGKKRGLLVPALVVLLLFFLLTRLLTWLIVPYQYTRMKLHAIETETFDDLILGTSHGVAAIDPETLSGVTGRTAYNAAAGGQYPRDLYYMLKDAASDHAPERVIYEYDPTYWLHTGGMNNTEVYLVDQMRWSGTKVQYFAASCLDSDFRNALMNWYLDLGNISKIGEHVKEKRSDDYRNYGTEAFADPNQTVNKNGFIAINDDVEGNRTIEVHPLIGEAEAYEKAFAENRKWFLKTAAFCRERGIGLVVVETPVPPSTLAADRAFFEDANRRMREMAEAEGFIFLDYVTGPEADAAAQAGLMDDGCSMDAEGHLHKSAAYRFTALLGEALKKPDASEG